MGKKRLRIKKGIFQKLVISYIVFAIVVTFSFSICLMIVGILIAGGNKDGLSPYQIIDEEGNIINLETVTNLNGWIEELDENYQLIRVYGEKKTKDTKYTQEEIYDIISMEMGDGREYIGFMNPVAKKNRYFLIFYSTDVVEVRATIMLDVASEGTDNWAVLFMIIFLVIFLTSCLVISYYLRRKIKNPLEKLIAGMEQVQDGKTDVALTFKTEAEFEQIRDAFNRMASRLEREKQEKQEMIRKKNQLILELSHDIKTPTATIKSYANALEAGIVPAEKMQDYYHTIDMKANRITQLSEDMIMLLKMDNADYVLQLEKTDLAELMRKICAEYYEEFTDAGFEFEIDIPERSCMAMIDNRLFTRVISNLLMNAKKYNQSGRKIEVFMQLVETVWQINVLDDGEILDSDLEKNLFDAFVRGDKARKSDGGTGLGLAISKAIVEKHNGSISYHRNGNQNCFRVCIEKV